MSFVDLDAHKSVLIEPGTVWLAMESHVGTDVLQYHNETVR